LCGSGSAVAAIYKNPRDRDDAARSLGTKAATPIPTTTRPVAPEPPTA
jgi:hypothetical protein